MDSLPLLLFPEMRPIKPPSGVLGFPKKPHVPTISRQTELLEPKFDEIKHQFSIDRAILSNTLLGVEPEFVLVIETAGKIDRFKQTIDKTGLEWLAEWDEELEPDANFYNRPKIGINFFKNKSDSVINKEQSKEIQEVLRKQNYIDKYGYLIRDDITSIKLPKSLKYFRSAIIDAIKASKIQKRLSGRLFLSMSSQRGLKELLSLWRRFKKGEGLPYGKGNWKNVFEQIVDIRRWGVREQLIETGVLPAWVRDLEHDRDAPFRFQLELFYRTSGKKREQNEENVSLLISQLDGKLLSSFIDMKEIRFHAVKVELPASSVRMIVDAVEEEENDIKLLHFPGIMFYRPTGQALVSIPSDETILSAVEPSIEPVSGEPIVAILDGVPFSKHSWLENRLITDDSDNLEAEYQPGERKHGTAMASLVIHGEMDARESPLTRPVYFKPILQPDPNSRGWREDEVFEYVPNEIFLEDRIARAVRRMFDGEEDVPAQAPSIKIINLSVGDSGRLFDHTLSPCAKLLDWLSWNYKVLFCISAGNYPNDMDLGLNKSDFSKKNNDEKIKTALENINADNPSRRLISPAESINNITVGSVHHDESDIQRLGEQVDLLPNSALPSPLNRLGYGFRRSVKPEIMFSGGRQFYIRPMLNQDTIYRRSKFNLPPGQKVATEGRVTGYVNEFIYARGTNNATALASRAAARIYDVIENIRNEQPDKIPDDHMAVLVKALLVHSVSRDDSADILEQHLKPLAPPRKWKEFASKFVGYGTARVERVLNCTEQRATVIGCSTINQGQIHEYRFPLPHDLANENLWRRLTITLAWFTPINSNHRYFRKAKLFFEPPKKEDYLYLERSGADHNQVKRGTVQHEILESEKVSDYQDGKVLIIPVQCNADATESLDDEIDYAIAVTLEVKEGIDIPIYQQIRHQIQVVQTQIQVS